MQSPDLTHIVEILSKQERDRVSKETIENQIKIFSALYDKAVAYTNIIILGGYASFFGLWSLTKSYLPPGLARLAALLMLLSVLTFVLFEVIKMVVTNRSLHRQSLILSDPKGINDPSILLRRLQEFSQAERIASIRFIRVWVVNVAIAVSTGLAAAGILLYCFVSGLICG
jgi:hypothetical protein